MRMRASPRLFDHVNKIMQCCDTSNTNPSAVGASAFDNHRVGCSHKQHMQCRWRGALRRDAPFGDLKVNVTLSSCRFGLTQASFEKRMICLSTIIAHSHGHSYLHNALEIINRSYAPERFNNSLLCLCSALTWCFGVAWLIGWLLVGQLAGWLADCLAGWSFD